VTCDAGLAAADTFRFGDPGFGGTRHNSSIGSFAGRGFHRSWLVPTRSL
jgi:hypothetical protein